MLPPSIHPSLRTDCAGWCIFGFAVSRNRLLWMARSLSLIKNGERESEVHSLFFFCSSFLCTRVSSQQHSRADVQYLCMAITTSHYIVHTTAKNQNSGQARWKAKETSLFFYVLCNDNDIINMNNAMSATTPFFFFFFS